MGVLHKDLTGADLHRPGYIQSTDPGAVGTGILWIDTTDTSNLVLRIRNAADTGWDLVGTEGLSFQGAWSSATEYFAGEVVTHNGTAYVANAQHTNSEPPSANWDILAEKGDTGATGAAGADGEDGPLWRGDWSSATSYAINDAVHHNGSAYIATAANTNSEPPSANWDLFAAQGDGIGTHQAAGIADHDNVDLTGAAQNDGFIRNASGIYVRKPYATQAEAEAGTAEGKWMSPLRTAQAIAALGGGGGGTWEFIAEDLLASSAAGITFSSLGSYTVFLLRVYAVASGAGGMAVRINGDTGNNYDYSRLTVESNSTANTVGNATSQNRIVATASLADALTGLARLWVAKPTAGAIAQVGGTSMVAKSTTQIDHGRFVGAWQNTVDAISSITLLRSVNNYAAGTHVQLFGRTEP